MGNACYKVLEPPTIKKSLDSSEVYNIIKNATGCQTILLMDSKYDCIEIEDVKRFLQFNTNKKYRINRYDCDDFSFSLIARFREWAYDANSENGLLFGLITGNLIALPTDDPRPHATGFFIGSDEKLYICDGMWNSIMEYKPYMGIWSVVL